MMVCFRRDSPELEDGEDLKAVISNPQPSVSEVLRQVHDAGGHFGMHKTLGRLSTRFRWPINIRVKLAIAVYILSAEEVGSSL